LDWPVLLKSPNLFGDAVLPALLLAGRNRFPFFFSLSRVSGFAPLLSWRKAPSFLGLFPPFLGNVPPWGRFYSGYSGSSPLRFPIHSLFQTGSFLQGRASLRSPPFFFGEAEGGPIRTSTSPPSPGSPQLRTKSLGPGKIISRFPIIVHRTL